MKTPISLMFICLTIVFAGLTIDSKLADAIDQNGLTPMEIPTTDSAKVALGEMLFFDKILSGNMDVSCATCHHPALKSADGLALSIGVGGEGLGSTRKLGYDRSLIPRNAPDVFNRGAAEWSTMFWDSRVNFAHGESLETPADEKMPSHYEFDNVLAAQAMFPVLSRDEMRGEIGDTTMTGVENELALISDAMPQSAWDAIMRRVLSISEYQEMFLSAFPDKTIDEMEFDEAANAIAAFEIQAFTFLDSPWDAYLNGDENALTYAEKQGALLFYGEAGCSSCHSGNLMTDQEHHNIMAPQLGPGKENAQPFDPGRYLETGESEDRYTFRTPPLRNVAITAPYLHNGAYNNLRDVITHHLNPEEAYRQYDKNNLPLALQYTVQNDEKLFQKLKKNVDEKLMLNSTISDKEVEHLISFLHALTDKSAHTLDQINIKEVPSELPVDKPTK